MADIFISYSRSDRAIASRLADALAAEGWTVWWDPELYAGQRFEHVIDKELKAARCAIILWSKHSLQSDWVLGEARKALRRKIVVPIVLSTEIEQPIDFISIHAEDFSNWNRRVSSKSFKNLKVAVAAFMPIVGHLPKRAPESSSGRTSSATSKRSLSKPKSALSNNIVPVLTERPPEPIMFVTGVSKPAPSNRSSPLTQPTIQPAAPQSQWALFVKNEDAGLGWDIPLVPELEAWGSPPTPSVRAPAPVVAHWPRPSSPPAAPPVVAPTDNDERKRALTDLGQAIASFLFIVVIFSAVIAGVVWYFSDKRTALATLVGAVPSLCAVWLGMEKVITENQAGLTIWAAAAATYYAHAHHFMLLGLPL